MGGGKKQQRQRRQSRCHYDLPSSAFDAAGVGSEPRHAVHEQDSDQDEGAWASGVDRHALYQRSVQSPKGDISYLQKFFLTYIGGRTPIHLWEDFCGTAFICAEWVRGDARRTALGLDLDIDALSWGLKCNVGRLGADAESRVHLLLGNVLHPVSMDQIVRSSHVSCGNVPPGSNCRTSGDCDDFKSAGNEEEVDSNVPHVLIHGADIICAFNYSCCCLHKRSDLVAYFRQARQHLSNKGGIFAMDLYGGASSECALKLRRRFDDFTYTWEQEAFDVLTRTTRISLHFQLKNKGVLRHAFSYSWRLWTLPEVRDCLDEAGFDATYVWVREMPDLQGRNVGEDLEDDDGQYREAGTFEQRDAWNAYVVAISGPRQCS